MFNFLYILSVTYVMLGLFFLAFMSARLEKIEREILDKMPNISMGKHQEIWSCLQRMPRVRASIFLWPKAMKWLSELEDIVKKI